MKRIFYTEAAYLLGLLILASGTTLMAAADFGVSMVAAPAYVFYRKLSLIFPWFTFGMAEYLFQAVVLLLLAAVMGRFRGAYLFSFVTTVAYGLFLDTAMRLTAPIPVSGWAARGGCYLLGMLLCALGVTLLFHTYFPPAAYELAVERTHAQDRAEDAPDQDGLRLRQLRSGGDPVLCLFRRGTVCQGPVRGTVLLRAGEWVAHRAVHRFSGGALGISGRPGAAGMVFLRGELRAQRPGRSRAMRYSST